MRCLQGPMPGALSLCRGAAEFWGWGLGGPPPGQEHSWCRRLSFPSSPHRRLPGNTTCQRDAGGPVKLSPHGCEQRGRVPPRCPPSAGARRLERSWVGAAPGQSRRLVVMEPTGDLWPWEAAHHAGGSVDGSPSLAAGSLGGPSRTSAMGGGHRVGSSRVQDRRAQSWGWDRRGGTVTARPTGPQISHRVPVLSIHPHPSPSFLLLCLQGTGPKCPHGAASDAPCPIPWAEAL